MTLFAPSPESDELDPVACRKKRNREVLERRRRRVRLRRAFRLTLFLMVLAAIGSAAVWGWRRVTAAGALSTSVVSIIGNRHAPAGELAALAGAPRPGNALLLDLQRIQDRLSRYGWVKTATVSRVLPGTLEVRVTEREPVAVASLQGGLFLVDAEGVRVASYDADTGTSFDLPFISGVESEEGLAAGLRALDALQRFDRVLAARVSEINCEGESARVIFEDGSPALVLGAQDMVERLRFYRRVESTLRSRFVRIDAVDLRFAPRLFVRGEFRTEKVEGGPA